MCLIYADFKHMAALFAANRRGLRNDSSIIPAKDLSIMPAKAGQVTFD
jgi:hypothetical protein